MLQTVSGNIPKDILRGIAITTCIFAIAIYLPLAGFFCALFIPLPTLFYRSKLGRKTGGIVPIASTILMVIIAGRVSVDIFFFFEMLLLGFVLSELIEKDLSIEKTILFTSGIVLAAAFAVLFIYSSLSSYSIKKLVSDYVSSNLELTMALYKNMDISEERIHMISKSLEHIHYALVRLLPALLISITLFASWTNLMLAKPLLAGKKLFFPDYGPLKMWRPPEQLVWGVVASGGMLLVPDTTVKMLALNGLLVLMTIYFFAGIAIVSYFFEKKGLPRMLRIFLYSFIAIQQIALLLVVGVGLFDIWLNFRKIGQKESG